MAETILLGEVTCPSGELVLMDGGYLGTWSGDRTPRDVQGSRDNPAVDLEVVGSDADAAARSFRRQSGRTLYDVPGYGVAKFTSMFEAHCRDHGHEASLRPFPEQVPHRERARRAIAAGDSDLLVTGVSIIAVGGLPTDRPLPVTAARDGDDGWGHLRLVIRDEPAADTRDLGKVGVDHARFVFADADALSAWVHDEAIDGLADVVLWGRHEAEIAAEFDAPRAGPPGGDHYGWLDLPVGEASAKAAALGQRRSAGDRMFAFDLRPHSHHWQVMAGVRAAKYEAATIEVGGAQLMFAMTSVGDGFFPVHLELDAAGAPVALRVSILDGQSR